MQRHLTGALCGALAFSLIGGAAAVAQDRHDDHHMDNHGGAPGGGRHWNKGERLDNRYGAYQPVTDWRSHHLAAPRRGYHWVRSGDDYVLAALTTGLIASAIAANR